MAHPLKKEGVSGHNDKLKRLTRDYGAANKSQFKPAKGVLSNGPQTEMGLGGEGDAVVAAGDRPRRSSAANPIPTYRRGGAVKTRADGGTVEAAEEAARRTRESVRPSAGRQEGTATRAIEALVPRRADGGRVRKPAATNINIIVSAPKPGEGAAAAPVLPPRGLPPTPPAPPPGPPPGAAGPMPGGPPGGPLAMSPPGAVPPGLGPMRKRGGRVQHSDAAEDAAQIKRMVKESALKRARGGGVGKYGFDAGAASGPGREEKTAVRARRQSGDKTCEA